MCVDPFYSTPDEQRLSTDLREVHGNVLRLQDQVNRMAERIDDLKRERAKLTNDLAHKQREATEQRQLARHAKEALEDSVAREDYYRDEWRRAEVRIKDAETRTEQAERERAEAQYQLDAADEGLSKRTREVAALKARAERLAAAQRKADAALAEALPAALKLANEPEGMDWGEVSNLGCDAVWNIERARAALADAPEPKPCAGCEHWKDEYERCSRQLDEAYAQDTDPSEHRFNRGSKEHGWSNQCSRPVFTGGARRHCGHPIEAHTGHIIADKARELLYALDNGLSSRITYAREDLRAALADAPEPKPCARCERLESLLIEACERLEDDYPIKGPKMLADWWNEKCREDAYGLARMPTSGREEADGMIGPDDPDPVCPECGPQERCDEDGCCLGCGVDLFFDDDGNPRPAVSGREKAPDFRPHCCQCGKRWLPDEGVDAQVVPCPSCRLACAVVRHWRKGDKVPP